MYVERAKATKALTDYGDQVDKTKTLTMMLETIMGDQPAADVAPVVHGEWEKQDDYSCCSSCGQAVADECVPWFKYCPNCGAKMDGGKTE